jgi:urease accessory protein
MSSLYLLLADGRFPGGGYAHSGGLEAAVADGSVRDTITLRSFAQGKLTTTGLVDGWFAAAACRGCDLGWLHAEYEARVVVPSLRNASAQLARGLRRLAAPLWPIPAASATVAADPAVVPEQYPVLLGAVARVAGLDPAAAAHLAVHGVLMGVLTAAPKLFAIDMADAITIAARLAPLADGVAQEATDADDPPAVGAPLQDRRAHAHASREVRLFAS